MNRWVPSLNTRGVCMLVAQVHNIPPLSLSEINCLEAP